MTWNARELALAVRAARRGRRRDAAREPAARSLRGSPVGRGSCSSTGVSAPRSPAPPARGGGCSTPPLGSAAVIACPSEAQRRHLVDAHGYDEQHVRLVELGVDARVLPAAPPAGGRLRPRGGEGHGPRLRDALHRRPARRLPDDRRRAPAEPGRPSTRRRTSSIRYDLGWEELRELYAGAACVVLPLRRSDARVGTDGSGLTAVLEAMASGTAVVASRRPALETYLDDGRERRLRRAGGAPGAGRGRRRRPRRPRPRRAAGCAGASGGRGAVHHGGARRAAGARPQRASAEG